MLNVVRLAFIANCVVLPSVARAQGYTLTDLGTLGGVESRATSIGSDGTVVGWSATADGTVHAFLYGTDGTLSDLGAPDGYDQSWALGVNGAGQVVGYATLGAKGPPEAFSYDGTAFTDLGQGKAWGVNDNGYVVGEAPGTAFYWDGAMLYTIDGLGGSSGIARAINASGAVAGEATDGAQVPHACRWQDGAPTELGAPDRSSGAYGINGAGLIVGWGYGADGMRHAFLYDSSTGQTGWVNGPDGQPIRGDALAVNDDGTVVGTLIDDAKQQRAFLWDAAGGLRYLDDLAVNIDGWSLVAATGTNGQGQIVGYGSVDGQNRAFLLTLN